MFVIPSAASRSLITYCGATQMLALFERRIVVVSGGGSVASALSRAAALQNKAVEAAHAPANSKSRRFACIRTSSNGELPDQTSGRGDLRGTQPPRARHENNTAALRRICPGH